MTEPFRIIEAYQLKNRNLLHIIVSIYKFRKLPNSITLQTLSISKIEI